MKIAPLIARFLLGIIFFVFGLNGFFHFIPMAPPAGLAGQFVGALFMSHFLVVVFALEVTGGLLLLSNRYVPLALTILGPVIVNIFLFHLFMEPGGLGMAILVVILWTIAALSSRKYFSGLFVRRTSGQLPSERPLMANGGI